MDVSIVGGGVSALVLALMLHARGVQCHIFEASDHADRDADGDGVDLHPNAAAELDLLGLGRSLDRIGVRAERVIFKTSQGLDILARDASHLMVGWGALHRLLHSEVLRRIGAEHVHYGHRFESVARTSRGLCAQFLTATDAVQGEPFDVLIGADGIGSALRRDLFPDDPPPTWDGIMTWRGTTWAPAIRGGASKVVAGGTGLQVTLTPIMAKSAFPNSRLTSWTLAAAVGDETTPMGATDWSQTVAPDALLPMIEGQVFLPELDLADLIRSTKTITAHPMCDRAPLPRWSYGRVTLLGDAAHPLAPTEMHGATQAILDARMLADLLCKADDPETALEAYDKARRPLTSAIQTASRNGGPSQVIDMIEERAPGGFYDVHDVADPTELHALLGDYTALPAFSSNDSS